MGNCRQDYFIASLYLNTPAKIVPSQEVYTRFGAIDLLAPPAGKVFISFFLSKCYPLCDFSVPHRNTGLPNLQESYVGTLFPRSVHNGPSSHIYVIYTHCVCIYGVIFLIFWPFLRFFGIFTVFIGFFSFLFSFSFRFLFRFSLKKR